jgi:hypothetical protein
MRYSVVSSLNPSDGLIIDFIQLLAAYLITSSRNVIASTILSRLIGTAQSTAWIIRTYSQKDDQFILF